MQDDFNLIYKSDCSYFKGYVPCKPHKEKGVHCDDCNFYDPKEKIILIIKLGAIGDVIRTTPLIHKIKKEHPDTLIWWLTYTPDILPSLVDAKFKYDAESITIFQATDFYKIINLDKDPQAGALTHLLRAKEKYGFTFVNGKPSPLNDLAKHKFLTGLFDDVSQMNKKSYLEEIFEICGWKFNGEEYILDCDQFDDWNIPNSGKKIIGLNTGCGERWVSRLWKNEYWIELIKLLNEKGYFPLLLGGSQEDSNNKYLSEQSGAYYPGHFSLKKFISLVNQCDVVVSAVTMAMHIAIGLKKPLVLMNNIFNPYEFELYGRGEIIQPEKECKCYFSPKCKNPDYFCMDYIKPITIFNSISKILSNPD